MLKKTTYIFILFSSVAIYAGNPLFRTIDSASNGNVTSVIKECTDIVNTEKDPKTLEKAYSLLAIAYTLDDGKKAQEKCYDLYIMMPDELSETPSGALTQYLAGEISENDLKAAVGKADENWKATSAIARFIKHAHQGSDKNSLRSIADEYEKCKSKLSKSAWGLAWSYPVKKWQQANKSVMKVAKASTKSVKQQNTEFGEESFNTDIITTDIMTIEDGEYAELRKIFKSRPKSSSLTFDENAVKKHILSLPAKYRKRELARYKTIKSIKNYLVKVLERSPYPKGIKTKKRKVSGTITMANKNYLVYKKSTKSRKSKRILWKDLSYEQYADMMEFYALRRMKISGAGGKSKEEIRKDAASDFVGAAIICDWFGGYKNALRHARMAIKVNPELKDYVSEIMLK